MPLGANVAGLPVCMGNTARSALRRAGQQAHHRRHARLHAELLENVLEMLLEKLSRLQASAAISSFRSFKPCSAMRPARVAMNSPQCARLRGNTYGVVVPSSGV